VKEGSAFSLGLSFQPLQIFIQLVFGNTLATFKLLDSTMDFGIDRVPVSGQPLILLKENLERAVNYIVGSEIDSRTQSFFDAMFLLWG
jgi:hypothetical protein